MKTLLWKAEVVITLKKEVLDPQGSAVQSALEVQYYKNISAVRVGKYIEFLLEAPDKEEAEKQVVEMADKILSNPVIEDYSYSLQENKV